MKNNAMKAVLFVLDAMKQTPLELAINDAANIYSNNYEEYMSLWRFLSALIW